MAAGAEAAAPAQGADGRDVAVLMSLVRSCEAVGMNPQACVADVLMWVEDWPAARVEELLPENWNAA